MLLVIFQFYVKKIKFLIYIPSRQALGTASQTKRPTSVVILVEPPEDNKYAESFNKIRNVVMQYNENLS